MKLFVVPFTVALSASFWGSALLRAKDPQAPPKLHVVVPMKMRGAMPALDVMVNGNGPYLFALDTGGRGQARADVSLVKELDLKKIGEARAMGANGKETTMDLVKFDTLSVGELTIKDVQAPSRDYNTGVPLPAISGIVGFGLFKDYTITLDYPGKKIGFDSQGLPEPNEKNIFGFDAKRGIPGIDIEVNGKKMQADIDSGNLAGAIIVQWSDFEKMKFKEEPKPLGKAKTVTGEVELVGGPLDGSLKIGEYTIIDPPVSAMKGIDRGAAVIGAAILQNFSLSFDQKNGRIQFQKSGDKTFHLPERKSGG